eukprot:8138151-Pyramimonas_sp.AAC.2
MKDGIRDGPSSSSTQDSNVCAANTMTSSSSTRQQETKSLTRMVSWANTATALNNFALSPRAVEFYGTIEKFPACLDMRQYNTSSLVVRVKRKTQAGNR